MSTVESRRAARAERKAANQAASREWKGNLRAHRERDPMAWTKTAADYSYNDPATLPGPVPPPAPTAPGESWGALASVVASGVSNDGSLLLERAAQFERLLDLSLERAIDIMEIDLTLLEKDDKNYQKVMSTQQSVMSSVFSTTARIDDAKLRGKQTDQLDEILRALEREQRNLLPAPQAQPPVIDAEFTEVRSEEDILRELMG